MTKTYGDLQHDAVMLSAAVGGLAPLLSHATHGPNADVEGKRSANALHTYVEDCISRAEKLADEMDVLEVPKGTASEPRGATNFSASEYDAALRARAERSEYVLTELLCLSDALQMITWDLNEATVTPELEQPRNAVVGVSMAIHEMLKQWAEKSSASCMSGEPSPSSASPATLEAAE